MRRLFKKFLRLNHILDLLYTSHLCKALIGTEI